MNKILQMTEWDSRRSFTFFDPIWLAIRQILGKLPCVQPDSRHHHNLLAKLYEEVHKSDISHFRRRGNVECIDVFENMMQYRTEIKTHNSCSLQVPNQSDKVRNIKIKLVNVTLKQRCFLIHLIICPKILDIIASSCQAQCLHKIT